MNPLNARALLDAWDAGQHQSWARRALTLLAASAADVAPDDWAALAIGERDRRLILLRERTFGPGARASVTCPACGEHLEFDLDLAALRGGAAAETMEHLRVTAEGIEATVRLPTTVDLVAATAQCDLDAARAALLDCCVLEVAPPSWESGSALPVPVQTAIEEAMRAADPMADLRLDLRCPACHHAWQAPFDIVGFLWTEVHAWAVRLLREVHTLASAYGWREADVLSMSPSRRAMYLELIDEWRTT